MRVGFLQYCRRIEMSGLGLLVLAVIIALCLGQSKRLNGPGNSPQHSTYQRKVQNGRQLDEIRSQHNKRLNRAENQLEFRRNILENRQNTTSNWTDISRSRRQKYRGADSRPEERSRYRSNRRGNQVDHDLIDARREIISNLLEHLRNQRRKQEIVRNLYARSSNLANNRWNNPFSSTDVLPDIFSELGEFIRDSRPNNRINRNGSRPRRPTNRKVRNDGRPKRPTNRILRNGGGPKQKYPINRNGVRPNRHRGRPRWDQRMARTQNRQKPLPRRSNNNWNRNQYQSNNQFNFLDNRNRWDRNGYMGIPYGFEEEFD